ncbi:unnamed protein product [Penicillium pancosmium]
MAELLLIAVITMLMWLGIHLERTCMQTRHAQDSHEDSPADSPIYSHEDYHEDSHYDFNYDSREYLREDIPPGGLGWEVPESEDVFLYCLRRVANRTAEQMRRQAQAAAYADGKGSLGVM